MYTVPESSGQGALSLLVVPDRNKVIPERPSPLGGCESNQPQWLSYRSET